MYSVIYICLIFKSCLQSESGDFSSRTYETTLVQESKVYETNVVNKYLTSDICGISR